MADRSSSPSRLARVLLGRGVRVVARRPGLLAAAVVALVVDGFIVARSIPEHLGVGPDSVDFLRVSREPLLSGDFWASTRAPVFPLLLRVLGGDLDLVRVSQAILSFAAWAGLAIVLAARMRTTAGRAAMYVAVLLLSATFPVTIWFGLAMSESVAMTLMAASLVVVVAAIGRWSRVDVAAVSIVGVFFIFVRDTNALIALAGAGALVIALVARRVPLRAIAVVVVVTIGSVAAIVTASSGGRSMQSLHQVVRDRVLHSPSATEWFEDRGLPDADLVRSRAGDDFARDGAMWHEPRFARYRRWLRSRAPLALATYVVRHPSFLVEGPYTSPSSWAGPNPSVTKTFAKFVGTTPPLGSTLDGLWWPESPWAVYPLGIIAITAGVATIVRDRRRRLLATLGVVAIVVGMASVVIAANLATNETPRHAIVPMAMARIGVLCALGAGAESLAASVAGRFRRSGSAAHVDLCPDEAGRATEAYVDLMPK